MQTRRKLDLTHRGSPLLLAAAATMHVDVVKSDANPERFQESGLERYSLDTLPEDLIHSVCQVSTITLQDLHHLKATCRRLRCVVDDDVFRTFAMRTFGEQFWEEASQRPQGLSCPMKTWREELVRIQLYQNFVVAHDGNPWTIWQFRAFWKSQTRAYHERS